MNKTVLKARHGSELRKNWIHHNNDVSLNDLVTKMQRCFDIKDATGIKLKYRDEEDDWITLTNDDELSFALSSMSLLFVDVLVEGGSQTETLRKDDSTIVLNGDISQPASVPSVPIVGGGGDSAPISPKEAPTPSIQQQQQYGGDYDQHPPQMLKQQQQPNVYNNPLGHQHHQPQQHLPPNGPPSMVQPSPMPPPFAGMNDQQLTEIPLNGNATPPVSMPSLPHGIAPPPMQHYGGGYGQQQQQQAPQMPPPPQQHQQPQHQPYNPQGGPPPQHQQHAPPPQQQSQQQYPPVSMPMMMGQPTPPPTAAFGGGGGGMMPPAGHQPPQQMAGQHQNYYAQQQPSAAPMPPPPAGGGMPPPPPISSIVGSSMSANPFSRQR